MPENAIRRAAVALGARSGALSGRPGCPGPLVIAGERRRRRSSFLAVFEFPSSDLPAGDGVLYWPGVHGLLASMAHLSSNEGSLSRFGHPGRGLSGAARRFCRCSSAAAAGIVGFAEG